MLAVVVAALTARLAWRDTGRTRFISEILAAWLRRDESTGWAWWGSAIASTLMAVGSIMFAVEASRRAGLAGGASLATAVTLLAVAVVPLRLVEDPGTARGLDFAHPAAAAGFYLSALVLALLGLRDSGPIGQVCSLVHIVSSVVLITMSVVTSFREFGARGAAWPLLGTRVLLDLRRDSRARWVRWFQWPATFALGVALCVGAIGV